LGFRGEIMTPEEEKSEKEKMTEEMLNDITLLKAWERLSYQTFYEVADQLIHKGWRKV